MQKDMKNCIADSYALPFRPFTETEEQAETERFFRLFREPKRLWRKYI